MTNYPGKLFTRHMHWSLLYYPRDDKGWSLILKMVIKRKQSQWWSLVGLCTIWHTFHTFDLTFKNQGCMVTHNFCVPSLHILFCPKNSPHIVQWNHRVVKLIFSPIGEGVWYMLSGSVPTLCFVVASNDHNQPHEDLRGYRGRSNQDNKLPWINGGQHWANNINAG